MPQKPQLFDPNEFAHNMPEGPPPAYMQPSPYKPFIDEVSQYIPDIVKSGWEELWKKRTDLPSRAARVVAEPMMQFGESGNEWYRKPALIGGAYLQSLGNTTDEMSSIGNVGLALASAGSSAAGSAGVRAGVAGIDDAIVAAKAAGNIDEAARLTAELASMRGSAGISEAARKGLHATSLAANTAMAGHAAASGIANDDINQLAPFALGVLGARGDIANIKAEPSLPVRPPTVETPLSESMSVMDAQGREIAPPQTELPVRPPGPWDQNIQEPPSVPITTASDRPLPNLPIKHNESIIDYLRRSGVDNINTTPDEQLANRAALVDEPPPEVPIKGNKPSPHDVDELDSLAELSLNHELTPTQKNRFRELQLRLHGDTGVDPFDDIHNPMGEISPHEAPEVPIKVADEILPPESVKVEPHMTEQQIAIAKDTQRMKDEAYRASQDPEKVAAQKKKTDDWSATQKNLRINDFLERALKDPNDEGFAKGYGDMSPGQQAQYDDVFSKIEKYGLDVENPTRDNNFTRRLVDQSGNEVDLLKLASGEYQPQVSNEFDPSTLKGLEPTPEVQPFNPIEFVDPNTGEIKSAEAAKPGDVPVIPEEPAIQENQPQPRRATKRMAGLDIGPTPDALPVRPPQPETLNTNALSRPALDPTQPWSPVGEMPSEQVPLSDEFSPPVSQNPPPYGPLDTSPRMPISRPMGPARPPRPRMGPPIPPYQKPPNNGGGGRFPPQPPLVPKPHPPSGPIRSALNAQKAILTSGDLSAPGRQGKALIFNKAWWTSWDDMIKAWGSKQAFDAVKDSIENHQSGFFRRAQLPNGRLRKSWAEEMGLELPDHEEMFSGKLSKKIAENMPPFVERSSRAHTAFLNKLRSDQFVSMIEASRRAGVDPMTRPDIARSYAKFINDATGRGSLGKLQRNVDIMNDVFFAPKNMSGQIKTWNNVLNPVKYYNYDPVLRKQALRSLFAVAGLGLGVSEIARQAGAKVSNDPTNSDFRKIKIGDSRIDLFGGYQQFPVAAAKFITAQSTSSISGKTTDLAPEKNRYGQQTRRSVAERFFINRLSPLGSFVWAWMDNQEFDGKPFEAKRAIYERAFPIVAKDIADLAKEDPFLAGVLSPLNVVGIASTQHYTGR